MNKKHTQRILTAACILGLSAAASAEQDIFDENTEIQNPKKMIKKEAGEHMHTTRQLVGATLYNSDNKKLGRIEEIVLTPDLQKIGYIVLTSGGFLGFGEKQTALPFDIIEANEKTHRLEANLSNELLKKAPDLSAKTAEQENRQLKETCDFLAENTDLEIDWKSKDLKTGGRDAPDERKLTGLSGTDIYDSNGKLIGELEAATINMRHHELTFAVIDGAHFESLKRKTLIVPWSTLSVSETGDLIIDAQLSQLEEVAFEKNNIPFLGDLRFSERIYSRFGKGPFWSEDERDEPFRGWYYGYWPYSGVPGSYY